MPVSMTDKQAAPIALDERIAVVDVLRGLAIAGILIGNMQWFSGYGMMPESLQETAFTTADKVVQFLVHFFVEGKFYSIFSFLFGFGFALQIARAEERGDIKARVFKRRLTWLFIIGALHATLLWAGDILSVYAVTGFVLLLFRKKRDDSLIKWAIGLAVVPVLTYAIILVLFRIFVPAESVAGFEAAQIQGWNDTISTVSHGSWSQILAHYNLQYLVGRWIGLVVQMRFPKILAMFLLGVWAYRKGLLRDPAVHRSLIRNVLIYGGLLGLVGNVALAALAGNEAPFPPSIQSLLGVIGYAFGVPVLALAAAAAIITLCQTPMKPVLVPLAAVGRMAMTNYLFQTVVCVTIFYGYGFAKFGTFGPLKATFTALTIFVMQMVLSNLWLRFFAYGPMEWIWRQLTYGRRLSLRPATT